jgi:hypothetical protein
MQLSKSRSCFAHVLLRLCLIIKNLTRAQWILLDFCVMRMRKHCTCSNGWEQLYLSTCGTPSTGWRSEDSSRHVDRTIVASWNSSMHHMWISSVADSKPSCYCTVQAQTIPNAQQASDRLVKRTCFCFLQFSGKSGARLLGHSCRHGEARQPKRPGAVSACFSACCCWSR